MKCLTCENIELQSTQLALGPLTYQCEHCKGHWVSSTDYWSWMEKQGTILPEKPASGEVNLPVTDEKTKRAKICPECDHILIKYKVGHETGVILDHCHSCGGVWFEQREWDVLQDRNLHDEVYKIFTRSWQQQVRQEEAKKHFQSFYAQKFGEQDYAEIRRIKQWIVQHPQRVTLIAYLNDENPYIA